MPVVPTDVSDLAREIYELGLVMDNDPTHFSIIGDCQNVCLISFRLLTVPVNLVAAANMPTFSQRLIIINALFHASAWL